MLSERGSTLGVSIKTMLSFQWGGQWTLPGLPLVLKSGLKIVTVRDREAEKHGGVLEVFGIGGPGC